MKVLFLTKTNLSKRTGATLRDDMFIEFYEEEFGEENIDVFSLFLDSSRNAVIKEFNGDRDDIELSEFKWCVELAYNIIRGIPNRSAIKHVDSDNFEGYDLVHVAFPYVYSLGRYIAEQNGAELIFDEHNVEHNLIRQDRGLIGNWFSFNLKRLERRAVKESDLSFCCSEADRDKLWGVPEVIPNSVDQSKYDTNASKPQEYGGDEKIALFLGSMDYGPNKEAANTIAEDIAPRASGWSFYIVGRNPSAEIEERVGNTENVKLVGEVDIIDPYIANADVCLAPLKSGSGTRLKILEYLAFNKPVISTKIGTEGIKSEQIILEDDFKKYPELLNQVISLNTRLSEKYTWDKSKEKLEQLIRPVL